MVDRFCRSLRPDQHVAARRRGIDFLRVIRTRAWCDRYSSTDFGFGNGEARRRICYNETRNHKDDGLSAGELLEGFKSWYV